MTTILPPPERPTAPPAPDRSDRTNFPSQMYNEHVFLNGAFLDYVDAAGGTVAHNAAEAEGSATGALASAAVAVVQAGIATTKAGEASASAASALGAPGTHATSATSLAIGLGAKTLTIQTGKAYSVGQSVVIADTGGPAENWMWGQIVDHDADTGSLSVNVTRFAGAGTIAAWTVGLSGNPGVERFDIIRSPRTSATPLGLGDTGRLIDITAGTFTQTFAAAATLGSGWWCYIRNSGSGVVTLAGLNDVVLTGETMFVQCDGSEIRLVGRFSPGPIACVGTPVVYKGRTYLAAGSVAVKVPVMQPEDRVTVVKATAGTQGATITVYGNETPSWTYGTSSSGVSSDVLSIVGTGTNHCRIEGQTANMRPPEYSAASQSSAIGMDFYSNGYYYSLSPSTSGHPLIAVSSAGEISYLTAGNSASDCCGIYPIPAAGKFVKFDGHPDYNCRLGFSSNSNPTSPGTFIDIDGNYGLGSASNRYNIAHLSSGATDALFVVARPAGAAVAAVKTNPSAATASIGAFVAAGFANLNIFPLNASRFLAFGTNVEGGALLFRVGTVSGTTVTFGTQAASATTGHSTNEPLILKLAEDKLLVFAQDSTTSTTVRVYGVTISGSEITVSGVLTLTGVGGTPMYKSFAPGFLNKNATTPYTDVVVIDSERIVMRSFGTNAGARILRFASGSLSAGALLSVASAVGLLVDMETRGNIYLVETTAWRRLSIPADASDTTLSTSYSVSSGGAITCMFKEGVSNREFRSPAGAWYSFGTTLAGANRAVSSSVAVKIQSGTSVAYRGISA